MTARLTLIGYRACGKTTIGRVVASRLGWPYRDLDALVEAASGQKIAAIFAVHGEAGFRQREAAALAAILADDAPLVLASGGGCILREENRALLRARGGVVVYLAAPAAVLQERLRRHAGGRPSLTGAAVADEVPGLLAVRDPIYRAVADAVVAADQAPEAVADALLAIVENRSGTGQNRR